MTKHKLANKLVEKYMPLDSFNDCDPSDFPHIQSHIEGCLNSKFNNPKMSFENMVYSYQTFFYFWDKLEEECKDDDMSVGVEIYKLTNNIYECQIDGDFFSMSRGSSKMDAFYHALNEIGVES